MWRTSQHKLQIWKTRKRPKTSGERKFSSVNRHFKVNVFWRCDPETWTGYATLSTSLTAGAELHTNINVATWFQQGLIKLLMILKVFCQYLTVPLTSFRGSRFSCLTPPAVRGPPLALQIWQRMSEETNRKLITSQNLTLCCFCLWILLKTALLRAHCYL